MESSDISQTTIVISSHPK